MRQYQSVGIAVFLIDDRPDDDGFGLPDADALLLREAATWIEAHPGLELTGVHASFDPIGRRQLTVTALGDAGPDGEEGDGSGQLFQLRSAD